MLAERGYHQLRGTEANPVLADDRGNRVDVHVYTFDEAGELTFGIAYPPGSLTGTGVLGGVPVRCIDARWMLTFKTGYPPKPKDLADIGVLEELTRPLP